MLQVFLETGGFLDRLAGILVVEGIGVTGISHTSGSLLGFVEEGNTAGWGGGSGSESGGSGNKGEKDDQFGLQKREAEEKGQNKLLT